MLTTRKTLWKRSLVVALALATLSAVPAGAEQQKAKAEPPLVGPKRLVSIASFTVKLAKSGGGGGFSVGGGFNNASGTTSNQLGTIEVADPVTFSAGLTEMLITALAESPGFTVVDIPAPTPSDQIIPPTDPATQPPAMATTPQFHIVATLTELSCRKRAGGISVGGLGGDRSDYENKVSIDMRLVDPLTGIVTDSVKAVGSKTSKSHLFRADAFKYDSLLNLETKILSLTYGDFADCPLGEACRNALADGVKKLIAKASARPWEAAVIRIETSEELPEIYLNVDKDCGLKVGDKLELLIAGEPITDQKSGRIVGKTRPKKLGEAEVFLIEDNVICRPLGGLDLSQHLSSSLIVRHLAKR